MKLEEAKREVAEFMKRCYQRGLTTSTGGNFSMRADDVMVITPSGLDKSKVEMDDIAIVEIATGKNLTELKKVSSETEMHRQIYLTRPDVNAICHSHPTFACLYASSSEEIDSKIIAETWYLIGKIGKAPYRLMGSKALAEIAATYIQGSNVILLENHGALAVGDTMLKAFDRLECLEQAAKLTYLSKLVKINNISDNDLKEIEKLR